MNKLNLTLFSVLLSLGIASVAHGECHPNLIRQAPDSRYTLEFVGDMALVYDQQTELTWQRCKHGKQWNANLGDCSDNSGFNWGLRWSAALIAGLDIDNSSNIGGTIQANDWRVPNIKELASLVDTACFNPAINNVVFPNITAERFWSSTPNSASPNAVRIIEFDTGIVRGLGNGNETAAVRLVRSGRLN